MKIVIHGTRDGRNTFTPDDGILSNKYISDVRTGNNADDAVGERAYSINFDDCCVIFSKYIIIRDEIANKRTGYIAFSVIISNDKRLSGIDVKSLLDKLADEYRRQYIRNNNLYKLSEDEDWKFVEKIAGTYSESINMDSDLADNIEQSTSEAGYIYYSSEEELQKYFDNPYDKNYSDYNQIFFVEQSLKGKDSNPLKEALKCNPSNNLTGKIEINNPRYTLLFEEISNNDVHIEVKANGKYCKNNAKVYRNYTFEISYSREHCNPEILKGKLDDDNIKNCISIDDVNRTIKIKNFLDFVQKKYTFNFITVDEESKVMSDVSIFIERNGKTEEINDNRYIATYEESGKCLVYAKKDDSESEYRKLQEEIFDKSSTIDVKLILKKPPKEIEIIVKNNDEEVIREFEVINKENNRPIQLREDGGKWFAKFSSSDINKSYKLLAKNANSNYSEVINITPASCCKIEFKIESKKSNKENKNSSDTPKNHKIKDKQGIHISFAIIIVLAITIVVAIFLMFVLPSMNNAKNIPELEKNKESDKAMYIENIYNINLPLRDTDSLITREYTSCQEETNDYCSEIKTAKTIRDAVYAVNIDELKQLYTKQDKFKEAINSIKNEYKAKIIDTLKIMRRPTMPLIEIAEFITKFQNDLIENEKIVQKPIDNKIKQTPSTEHDSKPPKEIKSPEKNSLETEFWNLVKNGNEDEEKYKKLKDDYKKYQRYENDTTFKVLEKICKSFDKFKKIPKRDRKRITLQEIEAKIK